MDNSCNATRQRRTSTGVLYHYGLLGRQHLATTHNSTEPHRFALRWPSVSPHSSLISSCSRHSRKRFACLQVLNSKTLPTSVSLPSSPTRTCSLLPIYIALAKTNTQHPYRYCLTALASSSNFYSVFEAELQDVIPVIHTTIAGTRIVGRLTAGTSSPYTGLVKQHLIIATLRR